MKNINLFCKEWPYAKDPNGYGVKHIKKKRFYVHRLEWIKHNGIIPDGMFVCHKCDNPMCYNIKHLFLGTNRDNMIDKVKKNRHLKKKDIKNDLFYFD